MSRIADYFSHLIRELTEESGIIIWYDPDAFYKEILPEIALTNCPVFKYEGSFFSLRRLIEPLLADDAKLPALLYVPLHRTATKYALIEAECAGCYLEPGHPHQRLNTRLEQVARRVLADIIPGQVESIVQKIKNGELDLADVDRLAESGYSTPAAALNLIYDKMDPLEQFYEFLLRPELDARLKEKNACREIIQLAASQLGYPGEESDDPGRIRQQLVRWLLFVDFITAFPERQTPTHLQHIQCPAQEWQGKNVLALVHTLRQRSLAQDCYEETAAALERTLPLHEMTLDGTVLLRAQTFSGLESLLQLRLAQNLLQEDTAEAADLLAARRGRYWAQRPPWNLRWNWLATVHQLLMDTKAIQEALNSALENPLAFINAYCKGDRPWHLLDGQFQQMEIHFHQLESDSTKGFDLFERLVVKARQRYTQTLRLQAEAFQRSIQRDGFKAKGLLRQRELFTQRVEPLQSKHKVAYIQVDALRYDLAAQILHILPPHIQAELEPALGQLPGITAIGMAAGLPGADNTAALIQAGHGKVGLQIGEKALFTREERKKFLEHHIGEGPFYTVELEAMQKPRKAVRESIAKSRFVWVTCQEIDATAENLGAKVARSIIQNLLHDLRRGILALFESGVEKIVISADHGFLFGEEAAPGERIDAPGGRSALLHRRVWIGHGGSNHPAYLRVSEKEIGLTGDLELIFPAGVSIFKSPGGNLCFFHGGISLQEMVIPVVTLSSKTASRPAAGRQSLILLLDRREITNRVFLVRIRYQSADLFAPDVIRTRLALESGNKSAGSVLLATPQPEGPGQVILIEKEGEVSVTCALDADPAPASFDLRLFDADTDVLLAQLQEIKVSLLN